MVANSSIVEIQAEGSKAPLFLVHGVGGGMLWGYSNLARQLQDQPIYAFRSRGTNGLEEFSTIEEIAAQYVNDLRLFQREGPYHIGGYCFGGNVAYEMARSLSSQGCEVAPLLLLNCWPNNSSYARYHWTPSFFVKFLWNFTIRLKHQIRQSARRPSDYFRWRTAWVCQKAKTLVAHTLGEDIAINDIIGVSPEREQVRRLWRTHVHAWAQYQPQRYAGDIVLFRTPGHPLVCSFDPQMGWGDFVSGNITVKTCRGDHASILEEENVAFTACQVKAALDEIQKSGTAERSLRMGAFYDPGL